ncbi:aminopeptidase [Listeria fleischmannii]|jgi:aminopeptidase|uniref:Aminopeptidase n=2 Tax=Listeria fleischmannii TaxID=1069827 RepID=A0A841YGX1_9LIST|nr:aminopeptidase [Listeria fleischmannii]EIA18925.1 aminopeptidase [Listeria fleischmannii subsp. coloradonensis]EUJ52389.1 putative aminopeptidase [Listeria fleischmannii FSL S10-1203]MBC1399470.1 aminopeptidase [Listeria fleischmannii]MBC1427802.1 aminopeptidase [Listeria fleischmannii]STY46673.1 Aminopeptidase pepS [Listeria fleischmannii subsp. coloradonensis]
MAKFNEKLDKYAELIVKVGVNVQPNQKVVIASSIESAPLTRLITKHAFQVGALDVIVNWVDEDITLERYKKAPLSVFETAPKYRVEERTELAKENACFISIVSEDPDLLKGVSGEKIAANQKAMGQALTEFRELTMSNTISWTVVAAASNGWAQKVFPDLPLEKQVPTLWEAIFETTRINTDDPIATWKNHDATLNAKADELNEKQFKTLHYTAPGTDLYIGLPEDHVWVGAGSYNAKGHEFMANMPTEEVFCCAEKTSVQGYVSSTKPLSYSGNVIDNFKLTFENGRISNVEAEKGKEILQDLVNTDEGSHYLGEVALVPDPSPISQSGILFYNTLFDENASNHLAIGSAYAFNIKNGENMSRAELDARGVNTSLTHVDFMIGSDKMNIDGITKSGETIPVFRNGDWAF